MKELPIRKSIRLKEYDYSCAGAYFVTICIKDGHEMLGEVAVGDAVRGGSHVQLSEIGRVLDSAIVYYHKNSNIQIPNYVIMPNHVHMIVMLLAEAGDRGRSPLQHIVRNLKSYITKQIGDSIWQKSFHDRIIRDEEEYQRIAQYIDENPARWAEDEYYEK